MKSHFLSASIVAMASATGSVNFEQEELDIILNGEDHSIFLTDPWLKVKNYDTPAPTPDSYVYGGECGGNACGDDCNAPDTCNWSWPMFSEFEEPWANDPDRACRC